MNPADSTTHGADSGFDIVITSKESEPAKAAAMDGQLVRGIAWTAGAKWSSQILSWACLLIVARLLRPSDFGVVGMAVVYLEFVRIFSEFGFGSAVITIRNLTDGHIAQVNTLSAVSGAAGFLLSCAAAIPLGWFFRDSRLAAVVLVMSSAFLISGLQIVPCALLQKELRFKLLSSMEAAKSLTQALGTVALAWSGFGYWSLVLGNLIGVMVFTALTVAARPRAFARPRFQSIRHALGFSWQVLVSRLAWNFYSDSDFLVAGRVLGAAPLGAYTFAWNLATMPVEKVTALVGRVTPAFYAAAQTEYAALRRYLRNLTEALAMITLPAAIGLALTSREFVALALGSKWSSVVVPLQILAIYGSFRSINAIIGPMLTALRETRFLMWNSLAAAALMPIAFFIGSHWGTVGIACGWIVAYPFVALPLYHRTFRRIGMPVREYLEAIRPALNGCFAMLVAVCVLKWAIPATWSLGARFFAEASCGAIAYAFVLGVFHAGRLRAFSHVLRQLRARKGVAVPVADC